MIDIRYKYKGFRDCDSVCRLRIYRNDDKNSVLVVASELHDNPGTSITNMAESLATMVCRQYHISPHKLIWVEHYPRQRWGNQTFYRLYFDFDWSRVRFTNPRWKRLDLWEVSELGVLIEDVDPAVLP